MTSMGRMRKAKRELSRLPIPIRAYAVIIILASLVAIAYELDMPGYRVKVYSGGHLVGVYTSKIAPVVESSGTTIVDSLTGEKKILTGTMEITRLAKGKGQ